MTSLPDTLVRFGAELEQAIGRDQAVRLRRRHRRRIAMVAAGAVVVAVGTASAVPAVRELFTARKPPPFVVAFPLEGRVSRSVDGVRFSFNVPRVPMAKGPWENGPGPWVKLGGKVRTRSFLITRSTVGGQRAEAVFFWTGFPDIGQAVPCSGLLGGRIGRSTRDLAAAMAKAPGVNLLSGPRRTTVGVRPAWQMVLTVRTPGCEPGFFFTWEAVMGGQFWLDTNVGDKISVWIVPVRGKRLVFEAETRQPNSQGYPQAEAVTRADVRKVEAEIAKIVASIRFA